MPENKKDAKSPSPSETAKAAYPKNSEFIRYANPLPTKIGGANAPNTLRLTPKSKDVQVREGPIIGSYWLNVPRSEAVITIPKLTKAMEAIVESYQREHQTAYFEQFPGLVILNDTEYTKGVNSSWLRVNYKKLCSRAAHRVFNYIDAVKSFYASMVNQIAIGAFNGPSSVKELAKQFKWTSLNTVSNAFDRFLMPVGFSDLILNATRQGYGKSNWGAEVFMYPIWRTSIWGNVGKHAITPSDLLAYSNDGVKAVNLDMDSDIGSRPTSYAQAANQLLTHMVMAIEQYSHPTGIKDDTTIPRKAKPHEPFVTNGSTFVVDNEKTGGVGSVEIPLNADGYSGDADTISTAFKESFEFWQKHMLTYYSDFTTQANSDWVKFFTNEIKLLEVGKSFKKATDIIQRNKTASISDLLSVMNYKSGNRPNTSTLVRFVPHLCTTGLANTTLKHNDDFISVSDDELALNFERYDATNDDAATMLFESKSWPRITPTAFVKLDAGNAEVASDGTPVEYFILNAAQNAGNEVNPDQSYDRVMIGKDASKLDRFCCVNMDVENSKLFTVGVTAEDAMSFVSNNDAICFAEAPDDVFVAMSPMIDPTDIFQCGFNIWLAADTISSNIWEQFMSKPDSFRFSAANDVFNKTGAYATPSAIYAGHRAKYLPLPSINVDKNGNADAILPYSVKVKERLRNYIIFVGSAVFDHPYLKTVMDSSMLPVYEAIVKDLTKLPTQLKTMLTKIASEETETKLSSLIRKQLMWAAGDRTDAVLADQASGSDTMAQALYILQGSDGIGGWLESTFNQATGPVPIPVEGVRPFNFSIDAGFSGNGNKRSIGEYLPKFGFNAAVKAIAGVMDSIPTDAIERDVLYSPHITAVANLIWFLNTFSSRMVIIDEDGFMPYLTSEPTVKRYVQGLPEWMMGVLNRASIEHPGIEDKTSYWAAKPYVSSADGYDDTNNVNTAESSAIPYCNIIVEPKTIYSKGEAVKNYPPRNSDKPNYVSKESNAASNFNANQRESKDVTNDSLSNKGKGKKRNKRHNRHDSRSEDQPDINNRRSEAPNSQPVSAMAEEAQSPVTPGQKVDANDKSRKPVNFMDANV